MAGGIVYLDIDDEITTAAARVRASEARRVAIVLPYGSRVATSRINLRLLSRDALISEKRLAVIAGDPATRALAASAGLPVFASVAEYESSLVGDETEDSEGASVTPVTPVAQPATPPPPPPPPPAFMPPVMRVAPDRPLAPPRPPSDGPTGPPPSTWPERRGASRMPLIAILAVLALVALVGGVGAYLFLPSATIVVTPRPEAVAAVELIVTADPTVIEPDAAGLVVPAVQVALDVAVKDTFAATGKRVEETSATGRVRFSNLDFLRTNTVPAGSIVSTNAGVRFRTDARVTVPRADLVGLTVFPGRITVGVTAVDPGLAANVEPNTIVIVPRGEDPQALKVVNPDATSGGTHDEFPTIVQADVDAALEQLATALDGMFQSRLGDPIGPPGSTVFPETATLGASTPTVDPTSLVGQELESFDLGLSAAGSVIAVDPSPIGSIAEQNLRATVKADHELVAGSIEVNVGRATISGGVVRFPATASARQIAILDAGALRALVLGKSLVDARSILAPYGDVSVTAWPDWVGSIPTTGSRVSVSIGRSVPVETPVPAATSS